MAEPRVEILDRSVVYDGYFRLVRYRFRHWQFAGGMGPAQARLLFARGHAAAVLPYDPVRDEVVLIEQFRIGAFAADLPPWLTEAVAGVVEPGEVPETTARREALEEAGCAVSDLEPIGTILLCPGVMAESCTMYCGRVDASGVGGIRGMTDEGEDIRASALPADDAIARAQDGRIVSAYGVLPLLWLGLNRPWLRERWRVA
jgi:ADP-ribose pyrophosphatase